MPELEIKLVRSEDLTWVVEMFTRLYVRQGYVPDGRGACRAQRPLQKGEAVTMDHDLILWLTKDVSAGSINEPG